MKAKKIRALFQVFIMCFTLPVVALQLEVQEDLSVYKERGSKAVLRVLHRGESVPVSKKNYGDFYKVKILVEGEAKAGFVDKREFINSKVYHSKEDSKEVRPRKKVEPDVEPYKDSYGVGLAFGVTRFSQGSREVDTESGVVYSISETASSSGTTSVFFDSPSGDSFGYKLYGFVRSTEFEAEATTEGDPTPDSYITTHQFIGVGALLKSYSTDQMWWGGWFEYAKATKVEIESNSASLDTDEVDLPNWMTVGLGLGYDQPLMGRLHLLVEAKLGAVVSTEPMQTVFDGMLSLAWKL